MVNSRLTLDHGKVPGFKPNQIVIIC